MWLPRLDPKQREAFAGFGFEASASDIAVATKFEEADTVTSDTVRARLGSD